MKVAVAVNTDDQGQQCGGIDDLFIQSNRIGSGLLRSAIKSSDSAIGRLYLQQAFYYVNFITRLQQIAISAITQKPLGKYRLKSVSVRTCRVLVHFPFADQDEIKDWVISMFANPIVDVAC